MRSVLLLAFLLAASARAADPLPEGARLRLGTDRMRNSFGWPYGILTPDGKHIVTYSRSKTVLLDVTTGREAGELQGGSPAVFSADGKWAAAANGLVSVWEVAAGKSRYVTKRQFSNVAVEPVSLSADGKLLAIGMERNGVGMPATPSVLVWDVAADRQLAEVAPEQNGIVGVRLSPDGRTLATFGTHSDPGRKLDARNPDGWPEQAVQLWNAADGKPLARFAVTGRAVVGLAFSPDSTALAASGGDGQVTLRDARTGAEKRLLFGRSYVGWRLAFSTDGATLAAATADGKVQRWNAADGRLLGSTEPPVKSQQTYSFRLKDLVFTGPDRAVAWGAMDNLAVVWEVPSGTQLSPASGHTKVVTSVGFTADGKHVLTAGADTVLRWDAKTGELVGPAVVRPPWNGNALPTLQLLPDGARAVSDRSGASVYDLVGGGELFRLPAGENSRNTGYIVRVSHDGTKAVTRLAGGDKDATDRYDVWDIVAPKRLGVVNAPKTSYGSAGLSSDGTRLVTFESNGGGGSVSGWEVATGKRLAGFTPDPPVLGVVPAPGPEPLAVGIPQRTSTGLAVLNYGTGKVLKEIDLGSVGMLAAPVFAPDGKSFAAAFWAERAAGPPATAEVRVFAWPGGELLNTFRGHTAEVYCLVFSPDGKTLATGSLDTTVILWDLTRGRK